MFPRPAPYKLASPMMLVSRGSADSQWDAVMFQLACWLVRTFMAIHQTGWSQCAAWGGN